MTNSTWTAISHSTINSAWYFINKSGLNEKQKIIHFTEKTKIRSLHYYNDNIFQVFYNDSIEFQYSLRHSKLNAMKMNAHYKKDELIGKIDGNTNVFFNKNFSFNYPTQGKRVIRINDNSHLVLKFKKGIDFETAYRYILVLDTVLYLMTLTKRRHNDIRINDYKSNTYYCHDRKTEEKNKEIREKNFLVCSKNEAKAVFLLLFENMLKINIDSKNATFPIMNYDSQNKSMEIKILEYYKALEYIKKIESKAKGKQKDKKFLLDILKSEQQLVEHYFGKQNIDELKEEIRSLRNYYSHDGFYFEQLPIPTEKPKRYKPYDFDWIYNVYSILQLLTFLEIYKSCDIKTNWNQLINYLR